ncbi:hypothetical protein JZ751_000802 [Albula glossodonta]|uniref:Contactin-associated protein-like 2 n=1 Tax=Albula glossodonta TaxID=121402 RepID=A0A8T2PXF9_9TELE|nr:hypothetical protein JZ751_000802 [Albula glossodonta]
MHGEGQQGDYITLELRRAKLVLLINLGSNQYGSILGHTSVTSGSLLDDHHWHSVVIERYRRNVNFTLDRHTQHFRTNGEFDHLDLDYELSFGGMPFSGKPSSGGRKNFIGCMESIHYNGENITDLVRRRKLDTSSFRNLTFSCVEPHTFPVFFNATSYVQLPGRSDYNMISVSFQFRTWNPSGLLMYSALADGMLEVALTEGKVSVHINVTGKKNTRIDISSGSGLNNGQWHEVRFLTKENFAMLTIDGDEASAVRTNTAIQIKTGGTYYFGGYFRRGSSAPTQRSFQGCMQLIHVDDQLVDLNSVEQSSLRFFENVSLDMCAIIDRCMPNHCEHGGGCTQTWDSFSCACDRTGYTGATCHTSVYEQSCEAYKHLGRSSDSYWIDPDGSGPLGPFKVTCNMTEDKVWTTVMNSLPQQAPISGSSRESRTVLQLNYSATMEQVSAITDSAEHCEQRVAYACRMSRLLNTPDYLKAHQFERAKSSSPFISDRVGQNSFDRPPLRFPSRNFNSVTIMGCMSPEEGSSFRPRVIPWKPSWRGNRVREETDFGLAVLLLRSARFQNGNICQDSQHLSLDLKHQAPRALNTVQDTFLAEACSMAGEAV